MFFAYMALRPVAASLLGPEQRLPVWAATLRRFFSWVWLAVAVLLLTGLHMIVVRFGGFGGAPLYVHLMLAAGLAMMLIFAHVFFAPFRRLQRAVAAQDWPAGGQALGQIRRLVGINLLLGLATTALAAGGMFLAV